MTILKYYILDGPNLHPERVFEKDGLKVIQAEAVPLADSWFIKVETVPDNLPNYYSECPNYKFTSNKEFNSAL